MTTIDDPAEICEVINDAAAAYRGVIPADRWHEPYMTLDELRAEIAAGVVFHGYRKERKLVGVMGLQRVAAVALIRHAYTRTSAQGSGVGSALVAHFKRQTDRPLLVGTCSEQDKTMLLRRYWNVPERQIHESVVLIMRQAKSAG